MNADALRKMWADMSPAPKDSECAVVRLAEHLFIGKSHEGRPCAVVTVPEGVYLPGGRATKGLSLEFLLSFTLRSDDMSVTAPVAVLTCRQPALEYTFAVMVEGLLQAASSMGTSPILPDQVLGYVEEWQELLRRRRELSTTEQLGLIGELLFICGSKAPDVAVAAWKGPEAKRFDFSRNGVDLDIKTSVTEHEHYFSLGQLSESPSQSGRYIRSLHVTEDPSGGASLTDVVRAARAVVTCRLEFERKLCLAGFSDEVQYEDKYTVLSCRLVGAGIVPRVRQLDPGVSEVRFRASLRSCLELSADVAQGVYSQLLS